MQARLILLLWFMGYGCFYVQAQCPADLANPSVTGVSCNKGSDGSIHLINFQGTPPYTFLWSTGNTGSSLTDIPAGTYSVTITDGAGCRDTISSIVVTQPGAFVYNVIIKNVTCPGGSDGSLTFFLSGGTPPYTYLWLNAATGDTLGTTKDLTGLKAGIYQLDVTDNNGCTGRIFYLIAEPQPMNIQGTINSVSCPGGSNGSILLTVTGGTGTKTYQWSSGENSKNLLNKPAGTYSVTVTDVNRCIATRTFTINAPDSLRANGTPSPVSCHGQQDGAIDISPSGGTPPYSFLWSDSSSDEDRNNLAPGQYCLTISDANGCLSAPFCFTIQEPQPLSVSGTISPASCNTASDGSVTLSVSGGTPPYSYQWSNNSTSSQLNGLSPGSYSVTVTDDNGCTQAASFLIEPAGNITLSLGVVHAYCGTSNGAVYTGISGGTPPYQFIWNNGFSTPFAEELSAGVYSITATDANGCSASAVALVNDTGSLALQVSATPALCGAGASGTVNLTVSGGLAPYSYFWSTTDTTEDLVGLPAGNYSVTVSDNNGCAVVAYVEIQETSGLSLSLSTSPSTCGEATGTASIAVNGGTAPYRYVWSTGDSAMAVNNLAAGIYSITATDANGCSATAWVTITDTGAPTLTFSTSDASCAGNDGSISVQVNGGLVPYSYQWSTGDSTSAITGLAAGSYTLTVTDAAGCAAAAVRELYASPGIIAAADREEPSCYNYEDGSIDISISQGTAPFSFFWSTGAFTEDLDSLSAGNYFITITDGSACSVAMSIILDAPDSIQITPDITRPACNGSMDGAITINVSGGQPPFAYDWTTGDTSHILTGLSAGNYIVTVSDANDCSTTQTITIEEPDSLSIIITDVSDISCPGAQDGSITIQVSGGTFPYFFNWSNQDSTQNVFGLAPGEFSVTVTDINGCKDSSDIITVADADSMLLTANIVQPTCTTTGSITLSVSGGKNPYTFLWSNGVDTSLLDGLSGGGEYVVTVTDAHGCTLSDTFLIVEPPVIDVLITIQDTIACAGDSSGTICASVDGVPPPHFYLWSNGYTTACVSGLPAGMYAVTVSDGQGCEAYMDSIFIHQPEPITITPVNINGISCIGNSDGSAGVSAGGGTPPFTFQWSNGDTGNFADELPAGPVTVTATDSRGCTATLTILIQQPQPFDFSNSEVRGVTCDTMQDGSILVILSGGSAPYTFLWNDTFTGPVRNNLALGNYTVTVTDARGCTAENQFEITGPRCNSPPVAGDDTLSFYICENDTIHIAVLLNDFDPDGDALFVQVILQQPAHGTVRINPTQTITYAPDPNFTGTDSFSYLVCDQGQPPQLCDTGQVVVVVQPCRPNIFIPNGFSPNGDGTNDEFEIPGIESYPDNELLIFNRWGNKVKEYKGYDNSWRGTNEKGEPLPDGTYYYILKLKDQDNTIFTGYVIIHR